MKRFIAPVFALLVVAGLAIAADVKSGLDLGDSTSPFLVKDITGPHQGTSLCYRCAYGAKPVTCIFTREITPEVESLVQKIDATVGSNSDKNMRGFVVLITEDADAGAKQLTKLAADKHIKNVPLTVFDGAAGPPEYKISKDAAVTVLMWNKSRVEVNHAFAAGKLSDGDVAKIAADTSKILN
ncbi:MAG TPA: hypothetical protein VG326_02435 [Tepidisphaeraceae bacterium]|jgi:hypothetical protein|nr:hypothetical protein [Tepidisphaeraceae bacterium]